MDRNLQLLGIAKKAGLLAVGGDDVSAAARNGRARLIVSACDATEGTLRRARINAGTNGVPYAVVPYTKFELGTIIKRGSPGTAAILDAGLAARFLRGLGQAGPEHYESIAELLEAEARAAAKRKQRILSGKRRTIQ